MRDGWLRAAVKRVARGVMGLELALRRAVLGASAQRYRLTGSCNGCGRCCEAPSLSVGAWTMRLSVLRAPFLAWQRQVNGFELIRTESAGRVAVFRCTHYDPASRRCDSYETRPLMCHDYPLNQTYEAIPALFDECSLRAVDKRAAVLLRALEAQGLPPERLAELKRKLFLVEAPPDGPAP